MLLLDKGIIAMDAAVKDSGGVFLIQSSKAECILPWNDCADEELKQKQNSSE